MGSNEQEGTEARSLYEQFEFLASTVISSFGIVEPLISNTDKLAEQASVPYKPNNEQIALLWGRWFETYNHQRDKLKNDGSLENYKKVLLAFRTSCEKTLKELTRINDGNSN